MRATASFAAGAAMLSAALAGGTFAVAHHYLLSQRTASVERQTFADARLVKRELANPGTNVAGVMASLLPASDTRSLLYRDGHWFSSSVSVGQDTLPTELLRTVEGGAPAVQRVTVAGQPALAVGLPLASLGSDYFEIHSLSELVRTLHLLAVVLAAAGAVTTAGGVALGLWAGRRLVSPLVEVAAVAAAISEGALDSRLPAGRDSDLAPLVASFNGMVDALAARIERDARFASDVSHELRSPLTTLQASVDVLAAVAPELGPEGRRAVELAGREVARFSEMVQDLLEISRIDASADSLDREEAPLGEVVRRAVEAFSGSRVPVSISPRAQDLHVLVDRRRLYRVLVNLLDNAERHAGGAVSVSVDHREGTAVIGCDDAGPGVAPEERERIFERFYRGARSGRRSDSPGTGLGLALAAEHIKAHGGAIWVEDSPAGGARFVIELPTGAP
jgi:two-component system, OmpR family, sensor histidine kinase MtrB